MKIFALILILAGLIGLAAGTISFKTTDKVVDLGPIEVTQEKTHTERIPVIASIAALAVGTVLLFAGRKASA